MTIWSGCLTFFGDILANLGLGVETAGGIDEGKKITRRVRAYLGNLIGRKYHRAQDIREETELEILRQYVTFEIFPNIGQTPPSFRFFLPMLRKTGLSFSTVFLFAGSRAGQRLALTLLSGGGKHWSQLVPCIYEQLVQMHLRDLINRGESSASRKSSHETYPDAQNSEKGKDYRLG